MISSLQTHWGFTRMPFGRDLPADNLFHSHAHNEAVARLRYLISAHGLGVLTGEVGSGKTVAVRAATHGLDTSRHSVIYLPNPAIGTRGVHGAIATALGQAPRFHHATLVPQVERALHTEYAEKGRHVILILDLCRTRNYADHVSRQGRIPVRGRASGPGRPGRCWHSYGLVGSSTGRTGVRAKGGRDAKVAVVQRSGAAGPVCRRVPG